MRKYAIGVVVGVLAMTGIQSFATPPSDHVQWLLSRKARLQENIYPVGSNAWLTTTARVGEIDEALEQFR